MNEDIMLLSNRLIYENRLKCGNEFVAKQSLVLPRRKKCQEISGKTCSQPCWVQDLMAEK
jgi:DNA replication ATP-dependent helicase Dna2